MNIFESPDTLLEAINSTGYIIDRKFATVIYICYVLEKPLLISGPPGTGKSQIAVTLSHLINEDDPIRLQCYDGITVDEAMYSFNYKKQLLYMEASKNKTDWADISTDIYSEEFLSERPLLKSIRSDKKELLLIDELDKTDEEFEAFLLEFLNDFQISIPEVGTVKAKKKPIVILTSNDMRELTDALRRRCGFYYIDYPDMEKEMRIVNAAIPGIDDLLLTQIVSFIQTLRGETMKKVPSISESIDFARILVKMKVIKLSEDVLSDTLNVLLKYQEDIEAVTDNLSKYLEKLPQKPKKIKNKIIVKDKKLPEELSNDDNWDF